MTARTQPYAHVDLIHPHPDNIREDLGDLTEMTASIRAHGVLQPLAVEPHPDKPGHFRILAGHRRYEAALAAGLDTVPITIRQAPGAEPMELMLVENLHREDLNPMDKAAAMGALKLKGYSVARIAASTGLAGPTVYSYLSLLDLAPKSQEAVRSGQLSAADALAGIRRARKHQRKVQGRPQMGGGEWEPDHFTRQHPLAKKAAAMCKAREHTLRRQIGKVACGQCWETIIRADERTVTAVTGTATTAPLPRREETQWPAPDPHTPRPLP